MTFILFFIFVIILSIVHLKNLSKENSLVSNDYSFSYKENLINRSLFILEKIKREISYLLDNSEFFFSYAFNFQFLIFSTFNILVSFFILPFFKEDFFFYQTSISLCIFLIGLLIYTGVLKSFTKLLNCQIASLINSWMLTIFIIIFGNSVFLLFRGGFIIESYYFFANYLKIPFTMMLFDIYILFFTIITLFISKNFIKNNSYNSSEYSLIIGFISLCLIFLQLVDNFFAMAILFECLFVLLLVSSAWLFSKKSVGALLKYFILNILSSGILFLSLFFLYSYFFSMYSTPFPDR